MPRSGSGAGAGTPGHPGASAGAGGAGAGGAGSGGAGAGAGAGPEATLPPSGRQLVIGDGSTSAVVTEVGGSLRELSVGDEAIVWPYPEGTISSGGRGQVLFPWPNRLEDGSYEFEGTTGQAALDEPDHHNAIHGLVRWLPWTVERHSAASVSVSCTLAPQPAYRWRVAVELTYAVSEGGLRVQTAVVNQSSTRAPIGLGFHPYLHAGTGVDGCTLAIPGLRRLCCDERGLPCRSEDVSGTAHDFRGGAALDGVQLDDCFTSLSGGLAAGAVPEASWEVLLVRADGRRRAVWAGKGWQYVMCFTGDTLAQADRRLAVAVEPMTCPPNAFRSGESLIVLPPGGSWSGTFGIRQLPEA